MKRSGSHAVARLSAALLPPFFLLAGWLSGAGCGEEQAPFATAPSEGKGGDGGVGSRREEVIHVIGDLISIAWKSGDRNNILGHYYKYTAMVSHSRDGGLTWSQPAPFDDAGDEENLSTLALTSDGERVFAAYAVTGEGISYDFRRVCLVALDP